MLRDFGHSMSIVLDTKKSSAVPVSYLIHYENLLQNKTIVLLENALKVYYKVRQAFCYKMLHLLQNATIL